MQKKSIIILIVVIAAAGAFIYFQNMGTGNELPERGTEVDKLAPDFQIEDLDGNEVKLSDYQGEKVFLNFWASWCPPCREEMPAMQELHEKRNEDITILAVNVGEDKAVIQSYLLENPYSFKILLDENRQVAQDYLVRGIPTSYFLDEDGVIINKITGAISYQQMLELAEID
ncbi:TlpA family protein disulfide reductase [Halanaerobium hydrogeniformans]|uniref:Alkyl hydroperoxide reductase/ Thiol specific antioxidant/ Mal allergen n=1 Tax=Halanaerobium hydrogeniformans TaxID=656519 RepID=E4RJU2_HALHG|nr:TlpA disulfide reductase family protein [Halanaerobium hydrogeniformans]ADQ15512.1 alkyl hydroperoxide reductase/ Thiol specific antioxidant/ Mal allergen [Halanaerobium hydrogeniformans]